MELFKVIILFLGVGLVQGQGFNLAFLLPFLRNLGLNGNNPLLQNTGVSGIGGLLGGQATGGLLGGILGGQTPGAGLLGGLTPGGGLLGGLTPGATPGAGAFAPGPFGGGLFGPGGLLGQGQGTFGQGLNALQGFGNGNIFVPTLPSGTFATCKRTVADPGGVAGQTVTITANVQDPPANPFAGIFGGLFGGATASPTLTVSVEGSAGVVGATNYEVILTELGNGGDAAGCTAANIGRVLASTTRGTGFNRFPLVRPRTGDGDLGTIAVAAGTATDTFTNLPVQEAEDLAGRTIALCLNLTPAPTTTPILPFLPTFDQGRPVCMDAQAVACCTFGRSTTMIS